MPRRHKSSSRKRRQRSKSRKTRSRSRKSLSRSRKSRSRSRSRKTRSRSRKSRSRSRSRTRSITPGYFSGLKKKEAGPYSFVPAAPSYQSSGARYTYGKTASQLRCGSLNKNRCQIRADCSWNQDENRCLTRVMPTPGSLLLKESLMKKQTRAGSSADCLGLSSTECMSDGNSKYCTWDLDSRTCVGVSYPEPPQVSRRFVAPRKD